MTDSFPSTHEAVVTTAKGGPLSLMTVSTRAPGPDEVVVRVQWVGATPLDLHQADGSLLITHPHILGDSFSGVVVAVGPQSEDSDTPLLPGDKVAGFAFANSWNNAYQTYITVESCFVSRVPSNISLPAAAAVPSSLVTAMHTITADLGLELPWPILENWQPKAKDDAILVWGAAGTVGSYAVQILRNWGYTNILAVASSKNHGWLRDFGAAACFDYRDSDVLEKISKAAPAIPYIMDCIGSLEGTLRPLSKMAGSGGASATVSVLLPVIVEHSSEHGAPVYEMDVNKCLVGEWRVSVRLRGVRTHLYSENAFFKSHLQPDIIPALLAEGSVQPVKQRIVEGDTLLDRAQNTLNLLRERSPSGEKLVFRVAESS